MHQAPAEEIVLPVHPFSVSRCLGHGRGRHVEFTTPAASNQQLEVVLSEVGILL